ncbi:Serpin I2 [Thelohanellus kitauei]|uniref:Serpin I2 n=1 Tax=Thelohanellus kitauei TaxID=669202 RepID=A0A0C2M7S1_THEKT|nr:Serpin I2 [Thelohanellus kitauei]
MIDEQLNIFTISLFNHLFDSQNATGNMAFSGIGLFVILGSVGFGLEGKSFYQLSEFLEDDLGDLFDPGSMTYTRSAKKWNYLRSITQKISNLNLFIFSTCNFKDDFTQISNLVFDQTQYQVDISNPTISERDMNKLISSWGFKSYGKKIHDMLQNENSLIFGYSYKFYADWNANFDQKLTKPEVFYDDKGQPQMVEMMNQISRNRIFESSEDKFRILFKSCNRRKYHTVIVLPNEGTTIREVLYNFEIDQMGTYFYSAKSKYIDLKLPKFEIETFTDFVETLKYIKLTHIFERNQSDFGRMTNHSVFIGNLIELSYLVIDDMGDVGSSHLTVRVDQYTGGATKFYVTRPFLFFIYSYQGNLVHISAIVTDPNAY